MVEFFLPNLELRSISRLMPSVRGKMVDPNPRHVNNQNATKIMVVVHTKNMINFPTILHQVSSIDLNAASSGSETVKTFVDQVDNTQTKLSVNWSNCNGITISDLRFECDLQNFLRR